MFAYINFQPPRDQANFPTSEFMIRLLTLARRQNVSSKNCVVDDPQKRARTLLQATECIALLKDRPATCQIVADIPTR